MYKHILIATDGSELAEKAVSAGLALAKEFNANITAITVTEPWTTWIAGEVALAFPYESTRRAPANMPLEFSRPSAMLPNATASSAQPYISLADILPKELSIVPTRKDAI